LSEEGPEHNNRNVRYNREHHARQSSLQIGLYDAFRRDCHSSDPRILRIIEESINRDRDEEETELHLTQAVINLLATDDSNDSVRSDDSDNSDDSTESGPFFLTPSHVVLGMCLIFFFLFL
jgi:hypothetical protein